MFKNKCIRVKKMTDWGSLYFFHNGVSFSLWPKFVSEHS